MPGLELKIASSKIIYSRTDYVIIQIRLINMTGHGIYLFPLFLPTKYDSIRPVLIFDITYSEGKKIVYAGHWLESNFKKYKLLRLENLTWLYNKYYIGTSVSLSKGPFKYKLSQEGTYRIKAIIYSETLNWATKNTKNMKYFFNGEEPYNIKQLYSYIFSCKLKSNEIIIKIK